MKHLLESLLASARAPPRAARPRGAGDATPPPPARPGIVRVVKGTVVEGRGDAKRVLKPGDFWLETFDTSHWFVNPSTTEAAELWVVDIVPKKK